MSTPEDQISGENKTIVFTTPANTTLEYAIGDVVGESYILLSLLARGGMGVLFKARHLQLDRIFALKLLPPNQVSETNWRRFEIEGRALAKLNHPNIVQIYNMGVDKKGCPFYVMELLDGQSMAEYLEEQTMPLEQFVQSFKDVCAALQLTHRKGIVHRDIKPSNLFMLQPSSSPSSNIRSTKVVDFGIARLNASEGHNLQGLTRPGEVFGSPAYMSPEQTEGKPVTLASDIYSLGCTMYAALTGHAPFKGATAIQTMMAHQTELAPPINRPDFSQQQNAACNEIITKCMEKAPEDRLSNVEEIAASLSDMTRENLSAPLDETTTNHLRAPATNQKKWLIIAAIATISLTAAMVAGTSALKSIILKPKHKSFYQDRATEANSSMTHTLTSAQIQEASTKLLQEKMPAVSDKIDLEDYFSKTNKELSEVIEIGGKKHRVFNFPTNLTIGRIAPNRTREEQIKASSSLGKRVDKPAQGKIIWPDAEPVNFIAGFKVSKIPEVYEHFDDQAIASLTLKSPERLPRIETLADWSNLQILNLQDCALDTAYTKGLEKLQHLESLTLDHTKFDLEALTSISMLTRLSSLQLDCIEDHSTILRSLEYVRSLTYLELRTLILNESNMISLTKLHNLKQLDLRYSTLPDTAMKELSKCPALQILDLDRTIYNSKSIYDLAASKSMRILYVEKDKPSEQILTEFKKRCPNVQVIRKATKSI